MTSHLDSDLQGLNHALLSRPVPFCSRYMIDDAVLAALRDGNGDGQQLALRRVEGGARRSGGLAHGRKASKKLRSGFGEGLDAGSDGTQFFGSVGHLAKALVRMSRTSAG